MALSIKSREADALARKLAALTGEDLLFKGTASGRTDMAVAAY